MAKILLLTPQPPYPPQQGTSLRNWHLLRALTVSHDVALLTFQESAGPTDLGPLQSIAEVFPPIGVSPRNRIQRLIQLLTDRQPDMALRLKSDQFAGQLANILSDRGFDAVQIEGIELARYIPLIRSSDVDIRIVLDCHNAETELQRRAFQTDLSRPTRWPAALYSWIQMGRLRSFEKQAVLAADRLIAVSTTDRAHLERLLAPERREVIVIPNTIDVAEYQWEGPVAPEYRFDLLFTGKMDYRPNVDGVLWFADEIWPSIREKVPQVTWGIVGQNPHSRLERLRQYPGITLTGKVQSIRPYLAGTTVYIAPLRIGSGTRLKLIEAMSAQKPIVSTTIGAEGFPVQSDRDLILVDSPKDMAQAIVTLLHDRALQTRLGKAAYKLAQEYDWRKTIPQLQRLYPGHEV